MVQKQTHWYPLFRLLLMSGAIAVSPLPALAQRIPIADDTLGNERSIVSTDEVINGRLSNRINGGARRGANLFHSFREFNINEGRGAYFTNPVGIANILARITGGTRSEILGTLGVDGSANLFLLNPNGIFFGPNAQLDIRGSFIASTGDRFSFPDGSEFSATNPQTAPLLTVHVPIGLQVGTQAGAIANRGNLRAGQDLTLTGGNLDLEGQLQAGRDLTLLAHDTIRVRDTSLVAFTAQSGRDLTLQGHGGIDILALQHPEQTPFVSRGALSLISDGVISADAHFTSGSDFQIRSLSGELAQLTSLYDPIISSAANVDIAGGYNGASLLIESQGNVRIQGNVTITNPDTVSSFIGGDTVLSNRPGLIIRSGQTGLVYSGTNQGSPPAFTNTANMPAGITLGGTARVVPSALGGVVNLTAATGDIVVANIDTSSSTGSHGGEITLFAVRGAITTEGLSSESVISNGTGNAGNGGAISLIANDGSITTSSLNSASRAISIRGRVVNAGNGGAITVTAGGDITTTRLDSLSLSTSNAIAGDAGNAGAITLNAGGTIITTLLNSFSSSSSNGFNVANAGNAGNAGAITLNAVRGNITTNTVNSFSASSLFSGGNVGDAGNAGNGGAIALSAAGNITTRSLDSSSRSGTAILGDGGNTGNGGAIALFAGGNITTSGLNSSSRSNPPANGNPGNPGVAGNGGAITLFSSSGDVNAGAAIVWGSSTPGRTNGALRVNTPNSVQFSGSLRPNDADTIIGDQLPPHTVQLPGDILTRGQAILTRGGDFRLFVAGDYSFRNTDVITSSRTGDSGQIQVQTPGTLTLERSRLFTSIEPGRTGNGGSITLSVGNLVLNDFSVIDTATFGTGDAGNLDITAANAIRLNQSDIVSVTVGNGNAGRIAIQAGRDVTLQNRSSISTAARDGAVGRGGDIEIGLQTGTLTLTGGSQLQAFTLGSGTGGNIRIQAPNVTVIGFDTDGLRSGIFTSTDRPTSGSGGNITVTTPGTLRVADGGVLSAQTLSNNNGGDITVTADTVELLNRGQLITNTAGSGQAGSISLNVARQVALSGNAPNLQETLLPNFTCGVNGASCSTTDNPNVEFSTRIPYATVRGVQVDGTDTYTLNISIPGIRAVFDVDNGGNLQITSSGLGVLRGVDTSLAVLNAQGASLATNDNADSSFGEGGSQVDMQTFISGEPLQTLITGRDAYLRYIFSEPGTYTIRVGKDATTLGDSRSNYSLHISLEAPAVAGRVVETSSSSGLFARTTGSGAAGDIRINTPQLNVSNQAQVSVETAGAGQAGDVAITSGLLTIQSGARISATATETATAQTQGGDITLRSDRINLSGARSGLFAETQGPAPAGDLRLQPNRAENLTVTFQDGAAISASTSSTGQGGSLTVTAPDSITLRGNGSLSASSSGAGPAGTLRINTGQLRIANQAQVRVSSSGNATAGAVTVNARSLSLTDRARLAAETEAGGGANIQLNLTDSLQLRNNSQISASTINGQGGTISINPRQGNAIRAITISDRSRLSAEVRRQGTGSAGSITIAARDVTIQDQHNSPDAQRAGITVSSPRGQAGSLTIDARNVRLNNGQITAETGLSPDNSEGGANIRLQRLNLILMRNNSLISARARGNANGGNLRIDATGGYAIALPFENNDIIATAEAGTGGNITIQANQVFGFLDQTSASLNFDQLQSNGISDISASSEFGLDGAIALNTLSIDPTQGLVALPESVAPPNQIDQQCAGSGRVAGEQGSFVITGRGGLPPDVNEALSSDAVQVDLVTVDSTVTASHDSVAPLATDATPAAIAEAQGWQVAPDGEVMLVAAASGRAIAPSPNHLSHCH